jgi:hypothetical protein
MTGTASLGARAGAFFRLGAAADVEIFSRTDFDEDGDVDGDDLAQWQGDFGANGLSDGDDDGDSDGADFLYWQRQLRSALPAAIFDVIPEPGALPMAVFALGSLLSVSFRRLAMASSQRRQSPPCFHTANSSSGENHRGQP